MNRLIKMVGILRLPRSAGSLRMKQGFMTLLQFNGSFLSLLFCGVITIGIIIAIFAKTLPLTAAKAIYYCQQFISNTFTSNTLFQVPHSLHHFLILSLLVSLGLGILSFFIQLIKTYSLTRKLLIKKVTIPKRFQKTIDTLGLSSKVCIIRDDNLFSLCFGILSPRIIITTELAFSLKQKELEAVLLHEQAHMQNRDPLKILLGKTVASMFFFLPIFSEFNRNMTANNELAADQWAITSQEGTMFLRRALKKILSRPQVAFATVPAISNPDNLEIRIHKIVNNSSKYSPRISITSIATSILFFIFSWFLLQTPVYAFQMGQSTQSSYFVCSSENSCSQKCEHNAQASTISSPNHLFSSQSPKYELPSYK